MEIPSKLKDNEYLLKIRPVSDGRIVSSKYPTGFLAKLTQKGELQKSFDDWGTVYDGVSIYDWKSSKNITPLPITLHVEEFKPGWKLLKWRFGKSQNWAELLHPDGFTLEIYLTNFLDIVKETTVINGVLEGEYKWEKNKLIKKI